MMGEPDAAKRERDRVRRLRIKRETMDAYGGFCKCCGETELAFLTIDHIEGGGGKDREAVFGVGIRRAGWPWYEWLARQGYPQNGLRVLCANCQLGTRRAEGCPHTSTDGEKP